MEQVAIGTDPEEKRFLAGALMYLLAESSIRRVEEKLKEEVVENHRSGFNSGDHVQNTALSERQSFEAFRRKGILMMGFREPMTPEPDGALQTWEVMEVMENLGRFDFVRDIMEDAGTVVR